MGAFVEPTSHEGLNPELTVVIPIFNTPEPLLRRAFESVSAVAAHGVTVETIAVDDGSEPACTEATLAEFFDIDARGISFRLVSHIENAGLASARNTGLAAASGRWIIFLDSDDALIPAAMSHLMSKIETFGSPVVCFLSSHKRREGETDSPAPAYRSLARISRKGIMKPISTPELALVPSSWSQVYRRDWLAQHGLRFDPHLRRWEDRPFVLSTHLAASGGVAIHPYVVHRHFVATGGSITKRRRDRHDTEMMLRHIRHVHEDLEVAGLAETEFAAVHWWISLARLLSVAGAGAVETPALMNEVFRTGAMLIACRPRDQATKRWIEPHSDLAISRLPRPLRALLIHALANTESRLSRLGLASVFWAIDIRRRRRRWVEP